MNKMKLRKNIIFLFMFFMPIILILLLLLIALIGGVLDVEIISRPVGVGLCKAVIIWALVDFVLLLCGSKKR